jgi:hypothetical protein
MMGPGGGGLDVVGSIYEAYIHELGERLRPAVRPMAEKIIDGSAGDVPGWGYKILASAPDDAVAIFASQLSRDDKTARERAAVALGYMGPAAAPAQPQVRAAIDKSPTEREQRLLKWCLREITKPAAE